MKTAEFGEELGRSWLTCEYDGRLREYAYPPIQGTHQECYAKINSDAEIVPAEGLDLALLANGAFSRKTPQWQDVKDRCFVQRYVRVPMGILWIPIKNKDGTRNELAGVLVERDLQGKGLSTKMVIPDVSGWKDENGIYVNKDRSSIFVPEGAYKFREINEKDGLQRAVLTREGAEIYVKTARDDGRTPWNWGVDISEITNTEQRVPVLDGYDGGLSLGGGFDDGRDGFAFGVRKKSAEGASQK